MKDGSMDGMNNEIKKGGSVFWLGFDLHSDGLTGSFPFRCLMPRQVDKD